MLFRSQAPEGVLGIACDITDGAAVDAAFGQVESRLGPVEVLVANAGITRDTLLLRMSDEDWDKVIDVNLSGVFRVVRRATRAMMRQRFGRIVATSSVVGLLGSAGVKGGHDAARAIMTTDTRPKHVAVSFSGEGIGYPGCTFTVGGMAKGSGMIMPNMATMIAVITTDAPLFPDLAHETLSRAVGRSFNRVTVDSDTSS